MLFDNTRRVENDPGREPWLLWSKSRTRTSRPSALPGVLAGWS
jgi:hypothetical protein